MGKKTRYLVSSKILFVLIKLLNKAKVDHTVIGNCLSANLKVNKKYNVHVQYSHAIDSCFKERMHVKY